MACACKQKSSGEVKAVKQVVKNINKKTTPDTNVKKTTVRKIVYRRPI